MASSAIRSETGRAPRPLAALAAALLVLGQLAAVAHFAAVSHEVCAHGQVVHGDHDAGDHHEEHATGLASTPAPAPPAGHDHCGATVTLREPGAAALRSATPVAPPRAARDLAAVRPATQAAGRSEPRYSLAPKTSPPATHS